MVDLTLYWQQIQQNHAGVHVALQWVAAVIYEQTEQTVAISEVDKVKLSEALELGFLTSEDGKVGFSKSEVRQDYLVRHAVDLALAVWNEIEDFVNVFYDIYRHNIRINFGSKVGLFVLLVLKQEYNKDIVSHVTKVFKQENTKTERCRVRGTLYELFCEALPELDLKLETLVDALELISQTSAEYKIYSVVENLAARSQENADFLYSQFVARFESPIVGQAYHALLKFANFNFKIAHSRALILTQSEVPVLCRMGIAALGEFKYGNDKQSVLLQNTLDRFNYLKTTFNPDIELVLLRAYGNLAPISNEAATILIEFASSKDPAVQKQVASILFLKHNELYNHYWQKEALLNLVQVILFPSELLQTLDFCIEFYAKNDLAFAFQVIESIALCWDYSRTSRDATLPKMLNSTFMELFNNHIDALNAAITHWFASSYSSLHIAGSNVIDYFYSITLGESREEVQEVSSKKTSRNRVFLLNKKVLDTLDEQTLVWVLYRLAGYITTDAHSLAAMLLSAIKREPPSPDIARLIVNLLSEYVLYNYPREAGDYLKSRMEDSDVTAEEQNVIREALSCSDAYFEAREKLPRLKELEPPSQRTYLLRLAKWKQQNAMMEEAERYSVFANICSKVSLKYGRSYFYERDGNFTEPSKLASFSFECELPQGEFIDPIGQDYLRRQWRNAGLHKTKNVTDETAGEVNV
ncbi:hypothetical protein [Brunnivagina elsteri]|uniref:Uncharacterized protein n=1 Tax=Brunnivagina elsteri CCALA 953 TaxID=987040 RepID=A0A2A2TLC1_9CYAN|nr:hypothetical protein [Calothrix elsteri]PAX58336.1 hypothetical protein CK510_07895 [Calothrix elsteri CCALA 953]